MGAKVRTVEREIARLATRSKGIVTRAELLRAGVSRREVQHRLRNGSLIREYPGVYRVGHRAPSVEASYMAAVRACAEDGALCGCAAGWWLGLLKGKPAAPEVVSSGEHQVPGLRTRRSRQIERTVYKGIPVTTVPRTLVDLAAVLLPDELARACHEAGVLHGTRPRDVERLLRQNTTGGRNLRSILVGDARVTLSHLEKAFLELLRASGLPLPQTNVVAGSRRVDCRWPAVSLTVELDSYRFHHSRHAWEQDRRREREARARGDEFRRYTYGDVVEDGRLVVNELRKLLGGERLGREP
jgi:hypothetical protein